MCLDSMSGGSKRHHVMEVETVHPKSCLVEPAKEGLEHQAQQHCASAIETHQAKNQASTPCFSDREPTHAMRHLKKKGFVLILDKATLSQNQLRAPQHLLIPFHPHPHPGRSAWQAILEMAGLEGARTEKAGLEAAGPEGQMLEKLTRNAPFGDPSARKLNPGTGRAHPS